MMREQYDGWQKSSHHAGCGRQRLSHALRPRPEVPHQDLERLSDILAMDRRMLLGVKERAERGVRP
jgi:hypothetical protein